MHISPMGYIVLKNVETTSDEQIMRGGGAGAQRTFQREVTAQQPNTNLWKASRAIRDELRLSSNLIFELSDDT